MNPGDSFELGEPLSGNDADAQPETGADEVLAMHSGAGTQVFKRVIESGENRFTIIW